MDNKNTLSGSCHCGNVNFTLHTNKIETDFVPRTCQCSLCKKHDASWISDPEGSVQARYADQSNISFYRFGHSTADFIICKKCGVLTMAHCELDGNTRAVLNIKSMQNHMFSQEPVLTNFDDETVEGRLERRTQNWTGNVIVEASQ